jgi:hypothetical protein
LSAGTTCTPSIKARLAGMSFGFHERVYSVAASRSEGTWLMGFPGHELQDRSLVEEFEAA